MTRIKILFIIFLLFLFCWAKSITGSAIDNENKSHAIKITAPGIVNERDSSTIFIKNDDILSISEFSKLYNPEEYHFTNFRFIKETNSDYLRKVRSKNNKTTLEIPNLEEYNDENKTERNFDDTIIDSEEESRESKLEELSTETNEIESTTIGIKGQVKTEELIEGYEDLEVPENLETTEGYFKIDVSNDNTNSESPDDIMPPIPSRRSLFPNEKLLLDYTGSINNKPVEIEVDQDTVTKSEMISLNKPNEQSKVESTAETPFVAPQPVHPYPIISHQEVPNLSPLLTLKKTGPADLREMSNQQATNFGLVKGAPDKYKQSNNLDKSEETFRHEKTIDDFNFNIFENAYPYMPSYVKNMRQQPLTKQPNFNSLLSKLTQASDNPYRNKVPGGQSFGNYGGTRPNFNLPNRYLQNVGVYKFVPRSRRFSSCNNCGQKELKRI